MGSIIWKILWPICSKQELWSQRNNRWRAALKQYSFLGNGRETNNATTSVSRQQILNRNRRPLLGNGFVDTFPRQRICIWEWTVLSARVMPRSYKEENWGNQVSSGGESEEKSQWQLVTVKTKCYVCRGYSDTVRLLYLHVLANYVYKRSVNPISNPKTPSIVTLTRDSIFNI
jgi:hypothetical protein